jgi:hypothetical protein
MNDNRSMSLSHWIHGGVDLSRPRAMRNTMLLYSFTRLVSFKATFPKHDKR